MTINSVDGNASIAAPRRAMNLPLKIGICSLIAACAVADLTWFAILWPLSIYVMACVTLPLLLVGTIFSAVGLTRAIMRGGFRFLRVKVHLSTTLILWITVVGLVWKNAYPTWWRAIDEPGHSTAEIMGYDYKVASYGWPFTVWRVEHGTAHVGYYRKATELKSRLPNDDMPLFLYLNILHWAIILITVSVIWERLIRRLKGS